MNIFRIWHDLDDSDRGQVIITLIVIMFFSLVVLYGFLVSRGHDVDYFKERMGLLEQRMNYMDQKLDKTNETAGETKKAVGEIRQTQDQQQRELEEHRKWLEYWKSLPQVPRPPRR